MPSAFTKSLLCLLLLSAAVFAQQDAQDMPLDDLDSITQDFEPLIEDYDEEAPSTETRLLKNYNNMRIFIDYEHLTAGTDEFKVYVQKQLMPAVVDYLQAALKVKYPITSPIKSTAKTLCGFATPASIKNGVDNADMVIILNSKVGTGGWMAATTLCTVSSGIQRPVIVNIGINTKAILVADPEENPLRHDLNINVMLHEFVHALGMNGPLYKRFVDDEGNLLVDHVKSTLLNGNTVTVLDLPHLTDRLRAFYGCDTIPGLVMEFDAGAHVARRFFQWDLMSTAGITGTKISEITLAFLEGTGWYVPDYCYAELYTFGKGEGCGFYAEDIDSTNYPDEFCEGSSLGCTEIGHSGGYCVSDSLIQVGKVQAHSQYFNCENPKGIYYTTHPSKQVYGRGLGSKCFSGNLTTSKTKAGTVMSYCLTFTCEGKGLNTVLHANWGTDKIICTQQGRIAIKGYQGEFDCPDPVKFCSTIGAPTCLRNCMGRGNCYNGKCVCDEGYFGTDCGFARMEITTHVQ